MSSARASELRRAFDAAFAAPAPGRAAAGERLLLLRIGGHGYALKLTEIAGLAPARKVVPVASAIPELLGLAGVRGTLVPVYSLPALLGYERAAAAPRWFVSCRAAEPLVLAFADFAGYAELPASELHAASALLHVQALARTAAETVAVLDVAALETAVRRRAGLPEER